MIVAGSLGRSAFLAGFKFDGHESSHQGPRERQGSPRGCAVAVVVLAQLCSYRAERRLRAWAASRVKA